MKTNKTLLITLTAVSLAFILSITVLYSRSNIVYYKEFQMYLNVGDYVGINVDNSALFFGTTSKGGSSSRNVTLGNNFDMPLKIDIKAYGSLSKWTYVSDNGFWMPPNSSSNVTISIHVTEDAEKGAYTGTLKIEFRK